MEIIEYEPINLYDGRFCKVFHSDWIQLEKPKDVNLAPHFHWHNSFEFICSFSGSQLSEIGSTIAYVKDNDFHGCPGHALHIFNREEQDSSPTVNVNTQSELRQWPCQIKLVPINAPYFNGAKLLIAAD